MLWQPPRPSFQALFQPPPTSPPLEARSPAELQHAPTSVDSEILHRHGAGHLADVRQVLLVQAGGRAGHAAGLAVQSEETCGRGSDPQRCGAVQRALLTSTPKSSEDASSRENPPVTPPGHVY